MILLDTKGKVRHRLTLVESWPNQLGSTSQMAKAVCGIDLYDFALLESERMTESIRETYIPCGPCRDLP